MAHYDCIPSMHGRRHLELETTYPLEPGLPCNEKYRLDVWFFIPHPLQHWFHANPRERFFHDLISYTRFKPFAIPLNSLTDTDDARSPLNRIRQLAQADDIGSDKTIANLVYELRMLVNVYQSQCRGQCAVLDNMTVSGLYPEQDIAAVSERLLEEMDKVSLEFEQLELIIMAPHVPEEVRHNYRRADEALSIRTEKNCFRLYRTLTKAGILPETADRCRAKIARQIDHRRMHNYVTVVDTSNDRNNELYSYREHQLKKWAESAMYMTVMRSRVTDQLMHISFGMAAALAMSFTVIVALAAGMHFHPQSYTWAILAVAAYVMKDRIKDVLRGLSQRWMPRLVADRVQHLIDPSTGRRVGRTRERVTPMPTCKAPLEVRRMRNSHPDAFRGLRAPEDVLHYQKEVRIASTPLRASEERLSALCEILRMDMRHWFYKMDKSDDNLIDVEDDSIRTIKARRVYHINVVLRLHHANNKSAAPALCRYRVVASRAGIVRIEEVTA